MRVGTKLYSHELEQSRVELYMYSFRAGLAVRIHGRSLAVPDPPLDHEWGNVMRERTSRPYMSSSPQACDGYYSSRKLLATYGAAGPRYTLLRMQDVSIHMIWCWWSASGHGVWSCRHAQLPALLTRSDQAAATCANSSYKKVVATTIGRSHTAVKQTSMHSHRLAASSKWWFGLAMLVW